VKVEIFPNTGVLCDRVSWIKANHSNTYSQLARNLLVGVFDMQVLLESNLKGGASKRDAEDGKKKPHLKPLDPVCLSAIYS